MEDFPVLLLFLVFYLIAASLSGKKKKNAPMHVSRKDGEREAGMILQELLAKKQSEGMCAQGGVPKPDAHGLCNEEKMHLHEVSQRQLDEAAEGEDSRGRSGQRTQRTVEDAEDSRGHRGQSRTPVPTYKPKGFI